MLRSLQRATIPALISPACCISNLAGVQTSPHVPAFPLLLLDDRVIRSSSTQSPLLAIGGGAVPCRSGHWWWRGAFCFGCAPALRVTASVDDYLASIHVRWIHTWIRFCYPQNKTKKNQILFPLKIHVTILGNKFPLFWKHHSGWSRCLSIVYANIAPSWFLCIRILLLPHNTQMTRASQNQ